MGTLLHPVRLPLFAAVVLVTSCATAVGAQAPPAVEALTDEQRASAVESFEVVWTRIRDRHWDPALGGVDWDAVRAELEPRVREARSEQEVTEVLHELVSRIGASHFGIVPGRIYDELQPEESGDASDVVSSDAPPHEATRTPKRRTLGGKGRLGIDVRVVAGHALVWRVSASSPALGAGVRPGWRLLTVDGKDLADTIERVGELGERSTRDFELFRAIDARLRGRVGDTVVLRLEDGAGEIVERSLKLTPAPGKETQFGHIPALQVETESRRLDGNIGYMRFSLFMGEDTPGFLNRSVTESMDCRGMVIDLRGNPGGMGYMACGLAAWFLDGKDLKLGTMRTRDVDFNFPVFPRVQTFGGPVAILIDGCSASTSEIFAQGMKDLGRARLFGTTTSGMALPSLFERLPNGDGFQYAVADYVSAAGHRIEGQGVEPHQRVGLERKALLGGRDPVLDAATEWIESHPSKE